VALWERDFEDQKFGTGRPQAAKRGEPSNIKKEGDWGRYVVCREKKEEAASRNMIACQKKKSHKRRQEVGCRGGK